MESKTLTARIRVFSALTFILVAVAAFVATGSEFWFLPPHQKFLAAVDQDIRLLEKTGKLPAAWSDVKELKVSSSISPAQEWLEQVSLPIAVHANGKHRLEVFVIHWIDGYRYGTILQYNIVESANNNTIFELNRTYKLGFVY